MLPPSYARAWETMQAKDAADDEAFVAAWLAVRAEALTAAGFDPVWTAPDAS